MKFVEFQKMAMGLGDVTEEPHFHMTSFRVNKKIFATVPPERTHAHIFVDEHTSRSTADQNPECCEALTWGKKLAGLRVELAKADSQLVRELLAESFAKRASKAAAKKPGKAKPAPKSAPKPAPKLASKPAAKERSTRSGTPARRSPAKGRP